MVLRDDHRNVNFSTTMPEAHFTDPLEVELLAILQGLQFYVMLGIPTLTAKIDYLVAV